MAGLAGAAMGAALTAVTMLFEMTRSYEIVVPMIVTVAAAYAARRVFQRESIYTFKLVRRGHHVPQGLLIEFPMVQPVAAVADHRTVCVEAEDDPIRVAERNPDAEFLIVVKDGEVSGVIRRGSRALESFIYLDSRLPVRAVIARLQREGVTLGLLRVQDGAFAAVARQSLWRALDRTLRLMEL
jgi:hypothetical protein